MTQYTEHDGKRNRNYCLCKCSCGEERVVRYDSLIKEEVRSCGHLQKESVSKKNKYVFKENYIVGISNNTKSEFFIDYIDFDKIKDIGWSENKEGYLIGKRNKKTIKIHKLIMENDAIVDHKNRNKLDNRRENLRYSTIKENSRNRSLSKNNLTGVTGVFIRKNKFQSYIYNNKKKIELGVYETFREAVIARLEAEKKYFGEFAPQQDLFKEYDIT